MSFKETLALLAFALIIPIVVMTIQYISEHRERSKIYTAGMEARRLNGFIPYLNTTIRDDFLQETETESDLVLLDRLQDKLLWEECDRGESKWWDGTSDPKNVWEVISKRIWEGRPEFGKAAGFEYWCNIMSDGVSLDWHVDKDEEELQNTGDLMMPIMGAVYYGFNHDGQYSGGQLHTVDAEWYEDPLEFDFSRKRHDEVMSIDAHFNRLVIFNASLWHRVTDVHGGLRYTFAVNALTHVPFAAREAEL